MHTLSQVLSGELKGTKSLRLSCGLQEFPQEIFALADSLELLDLSGNHLSQLPEEMGLFKQLKIAFFSNNDFTEFPTVLAGCPQLEMIGFKANQISRIPENAFPPLLRWLILTDNHIPSIPASIGRCPRMQKFMLAGNKITELPIEMENCQHLELLRISANQLRELPEWLLSLPRLSWLAYGANPCANTSRLPKGVKEIPWSELSLEKLLGEGASGLIYQAVWTLPATGQIHEVAVKVFKGAVTSDGLAEEERNACLAAGTHPHLVPILGTVQAHPEGKDALVLALIPPDFKNLGGPPSFETCTRDVFSSNAVFSLHSLLSIALGIADVARHLHLHTIMHGDLYAHNVLVDDHAHPLLGDFGAATFYDREEKGKTFLLERIEVRAFGCLLDDLLEHLLFEDQQNPFVEEVKQLRYICMQEEIHRRPDFKFLKECLENIKSRKVKLDEN